MAQTSLRLYNTRTRSVELFEPVRPGRVRIYVCGLTPSAEAHLGHARSFLIFDVLRRWLRVSGYDVTYVQNVTDIDDRSIAAARVEGRPWNEVVEAHYASFKASMRRLGVREPDEEPRATAFIPQILEMIEALVDRGLAYPSTDGVYYSVRSFPAYGELSHRNIDELLVGARIAVGEDKHDPLDFALWKFAKPGEPAWASKYGPGRPGWHIECSAMAHWLLGEPFDIHGGGFDLVFPHHENEIAQTEGLFGITMAEVWMHGGLLMFDNRKMSKSLGNFEPLSALLHRHDPQAIRLLFLQTGYRKPMNFTEESIGAAHVTLTSIRAGYRALHARAGGRMSPDRQWTAELGEAVKAALDDDLNTAVALSKVIAAAANNAELAGRHRTPAEALAELHEMLDILGLTPSAEWLEEPSAAPVAFPADFVERLRERIPEVHLNGDGPEAAIEAVIEARNAARRARDFALADRLRDALAVVHVTLKDSRDGTTWTVEG